MHFCTVAAPDAARVQKRTVYVHNCITTGAKSSRVQKCTPTSPTQRS